LCVPAANDVADRQHREREQVCCPLCPDRGCKGAGRLPRGRRPLPLRFRAQASQPAPFRSFGTLLERLGYSGASTLTFLIRTHDSHRERQGSTRVCCVHCLAFRPLKVDARERKRGKPNERLVLHDTSGFRRASGVLLLCNQRQPGLRCPYRRRAAAPYLQLLRARSATVPSFLVTASEGSQLRLFRPIPTRPEPRLARLAPVGFPFVRSR
jgi:hypothetical protein